jgi:oligopeptide transport system permease protein
VVFAIAILAISAPWLTPYGYDETSADQFQPPSIRHPMGTDVHGRDLLTRVLYGARLSLCIGLVATLVSIVIGVGYGAVSGYVGGSTDDIMMRIVDVIYSLPYMFFVIILVAVFGRSVLLLFLALGAVQWLTVARIVRGQVLAVREKEFIQASYAAGAGHLRIIVNHLLPNVLGPVIVYMTLTVPAVMLQEAFLSFLGLGVPPPASSWGTLIADGASAINMLRIYWWLLLFPGVAMALTLLALNFIGDGFRDALDPQAR